MELLLASIAATAAGPLLIVLAKDRAKILAAFDSFVLVGLAGLVLLLVFPHSIEMAGGWAALALAAGVIAPNLFERGMRRSDKPHQHHEAVAAMALLGLGVHAFVDGAALNAGDAAGASLAVAVILHRLPVGMAVWSRLRIQLAVPVLLLLIIATVSGYWLGHTILPEATSSGIALFEAFVGGALLHVALEPAVQTQVRAARSEMASGLGALLAIGVVIVLSGAHPSEHADHEGHGGIASAFLTLSLESAPALLVGFIGAGLMHGLLQRRTMTWLSRGGRFAQATRGMAFGLPLPLCSCGVLPTYRALAIAGAPPAAGLAFLVATPEIGLDAFFLSFSLLGWELALIRIGSAAIVALAVGLILARVSSPSAPPEPVAEDTSLDSKQRLTNAFRFSFGELFEHTMPWVLLGLGVAAFVEPYFDVAALAALPLGLDVVVMAVIGMPTYICASGATPLVAVLLLKGLSPGAAIAFLLTGPATNLTTVGVLTKLHGRRAAIGFAVLVTGLSIALGWIINGFGGDLAQIPADLANLEEHQPTVIEMASLAVLTVLLIAALLRRGARGLVEEVLSALESDDHSHAHSSDG